MSLEFGVGAAYMYPYYSSSRIFLGIGLGFVGHYRVFFLFTSYKGRWYGTGDAPVLSPTHCSRAG